MEDSLPKLLDRQVIEVLQILNPELIRPTNLIDLVEETVNTHSMLKDVKTRNILINTMKPNEAEAFARSVGLKQWNDVYYALAKKKFRKNELKSALEFFGGKIEEEVGEKKMDIEHVATPKPLFTHQIETVYNLRKKLSTEPHKALLHMPTGSGKTLCAMRVVISYMLANPNTLVIWLAHNEELCEQALTEFKHTWKLAGDRKINIYRFFGSSKINPHTVNHGFMSASLSKMLGSAKKSNTFLSRLAKNTDLVVIDEAHQATAPKFSIIIEELSINRNTWLLGLSATPGRSSGVMNQENIDLARFFGKNKEILNTKHENPIKFLVRKGYLAKPTFKPIIHDGAQLSVDDIQRIENEVDVPQKILEKLSIDTKRNLSIVSEIMRLLKNHNKIIVFAASVNHAKVISLILSAKKYFSRYITSKTPSELRSQILEDYKCPNKQMILCNYGILTMGFDAPQTSAVVIARPTKSYVLYAQMVGRGIRGPEAGGNKTCEISTVIDKDIAAFIHISDIFTMWDGAWDE